MKAVRIIVLSIIRVASRTLSISFAEILCQIEIPHKQNAAIAIPARIAAVFLRRLSSEKIKTWFAV